MEISKEKKTEILLNFFKETGKTAYKISQETGLNISGLARLLKNEIKNPHKTTINTLYEHYIQEPVSKEELNEPLTNYATKEKNSLDDYSVTELVEYIIENEKTAKFQDSAVFKMFKELIVARSTQ